MSAPTGVPRIFRKMRTKMRKLNPARISALEQQRVGRYEVVNRLRDIIAGDLLLKVDEFDGEFFIDPRSDLARRIFLDGAYEPGLVKWARLAADVNRDVIDVGANIGFYSVLLARHIASDRKVVALEPCAGAYEILVKNVEHNKVDHKVISVPYAASNQMGSSYLHEIPGKSEYSSLSPLVHPSTLKANKLMHKVLTVTVDNVVKNKNIYPGFVKIDVEGAEHLVIEGAIKTINEYRPVVLLELSDCLLRAAGSSADHVLEIMRRMRYEILDPINQSVTPGTRAFGDIICFPTENGRWREFLEFDK